MNSKASVYSLSSTEMYPMSAIEETYFLLSSGLVSVELVRLRAVVSKFGKEQFTRSSPTKM